MIGLSTIGANLKEVKIKGPVVFAAGSFFISFSLLGTLNTL